MWIEKLEEKIGKDTSEIFKDELHFIRNFLLNSNIEKPSREDLEQFLITKLKKCLDETFIMWDNE